MPITIGGNGFNAAPILDADARRQALLEQATNWATTRNDQDVQQNQQFAAQHAANNATLAHQNLEAGIRAQAIQQHQSDQAQQLGEHQDTLANSAQNRQDTIAQQQAQQAQHDAEFKAGEMRKSQAHDDWLSERQDRDTAQASAKDQQTIDREAMFARKPFDVMAHEMIEKGAGDVAMDQLTKAQAAEQAVRAAHNKPLQANIAGAMDTNDFSPDDWSPSTEPQPAEPAVRAPADVFAQDNADKAAARADAVARQKERADQMIDVHDSMDQDRADRRELRKQQMAERKSAQDLKDATYQHLKGEVDKVDPAKKDAYIAAKMAMASGAKPDMDTINGNEFLKKAWAENALETVKHNQTNLMQPLTETEVWNRNNKKDAERIHLLSRAAQEAQAQPTGPRMAVGGGETPDADTADYLKAKGVTPPQSQPANPYMGPPKPAAAQPAKTIVKNGHTYVMKPDGSGYKLKE